VIDYTQYPVKVERALSELFTFINELKPELVVIDSMTGFFSQSSKALPESDVREMVWKVHTACDGKVPIIGISEVRGQGFSRAPAGGQGVMHGCSMLMDFKRSTVRYEGQIELYGAEFGDVVYEMQVLKDKGNAATIYPQRIKWSKEAGYDIKQIKKG
jgi:predicted ATP-dependent serine protease